MTGIVFQLDRVGGADILRNNKKIAAIQDSTMSALMGSVEAQFFQAFGVEGKFEIYQQTSDRYQVIMRGADKRTTVILKANPGWLGQFVSGIRI